MQLNPRSLRMRRSFFRRESMSFFNWFSGKSSKRRNASGTAQPDNGSSGLTRDDRSRPLAEAREKASVAVSLNGGPNVASATGQTSQGRSQRHAKRELLYTAVREAMIRAGVLSASYKFKVLSLDPRGDQFMVMMDLAQQFGGQTERLAEIEVMIAQSAKSRYDIRVTAVYWRMNELVAIGRPQSRGHGTSRNPDSLGAESLHAALNAALAGPASAAQSLATSRYEPIQADEVAAFKQALAAASAQGAAAAGKGVTTRTGPWSYTLLTGFEDTEMTESPALVPALSSTQYGDLH